MFCIISGRYIKWRSHIINACRRHVSITIIAYVVVVTVGGVPFIPDFRKISQLIQTLEWEGTQRACWCHKPNIVLKEESDNKMGYSSTILNNHFLKEDSVSCSFSTQEVCSAGRQNSRQFCMVISKEMIIVVLIYRSQFSWQDQENNDRPPRELPVFRQRFDPGTFRTPPVSKLWWIASADRWWQMWDIWRLEFVSNLTSDQASNSSQMSPLLSRFLHLKISEPLCGFPTFGTA